MAIVPLLLAAALVAASYGIRVTTPVRVEVVARTVMFNAPEGRDVQLLNNLTAFSDLAIESCEDVRFPPLSVTLPGDSVVQTGAITFRCDQQRLRDSSRVRIRLPRGSQGAGDESMPAADLGSVDSILARGGDRVTLELTSVRPPAVRLDLPGGVEFDASIRRGVPFEIVAEFAETGNAQLPQDADGVTEYRAQLASDTNRQVTMRAADRLSLVIEPAGDAAAKDFFVRGLNAPVESISLFQYIDEKLALESTAIEGMLHYTDAAVDPVPISEEEGVHFPSGSGFRLTGLGFDPARNGLMLRAEGDAAMLITSGEDRRLRLFDRLVSDRTNSIVGLITVVLSQLLWLRDLWWPGRGSK